MRNAPNYYTLLLLITVLFTATSATGQESGNTQSYPYTYKQGYKFADKAENAIAAGNYVKADKLLEKALKADYGFCGNAWASAHGRINNLKAQSLIKQGKAMEALDILEETTGCGIGADCQKRDELKISALVALYGKDKIIFAIENHRDFNKPETFYDSQFSIYLPGINYLLKFSADHYTYGSDIQDPLFFIKSQTFYKQLQQD